MTTRREAQLLLLNRDLESKLAALREGALLTDAALKAGDKFSAGLLAQGLVARILDVTAPTAEDPGQCDVCGHDLEGGDCTNGLCPRYDDGTRPATDAMDYELPEAS